MSSNTLSSEFAISPNYRDKFDHIRGVVLHHVYSEGTQFLKLNENPSADEQLRIGERYQEEFDPDTGTNAD